MLPDLYKIGSGNYLGNINAKIYDPYFARTGLNTRQELPPKLCPVVSWSVEAQALK